MSNSLVRFMAEAIRMDHLPNVDPSLLLPHVISAPFLCPCNDAWAVLLDKPLTLEYELGVEGKKHAFLLLLAVTEDCKAGHPASFYKTDGISVWPMP